MRRLIRTFARAGQDSDVWPVVLLLFAVLVPAVCLLWFMNAAMRNERFAARQELADVYRARLSSSQARLEQYWKDTAQELEKLTRVTPPSVAFAQCVQSATVDSVIIFDEAGRILYPSAPCAPKTGSSELEPKWTEAGQLEYLRKDFIAAASRYRALAKEATNASVAARALQAEARCLVQAGLRDEAIRLVDEVLGRERFDRVADPQGRLIVANAELMVLELLTNHAAPVFQATARRLQKKLMNYENPALAAPQRRFLMKELQRLSPQIEFPTLAAEELAAEVMGSTGHWPVPSGDPPDGTGTTSSRKSDAPFTATSPSIPLGGSPSGAGESPGESPALPLQRASLPGLWQFTTPGRRVLALVRSEKLLAGLRPVVASDSLSADAEIALLPPDVDHAAAFVTLPAGEQLPGWRLALLLKDRKLFDTTTEHRTSIYLWTGLLMIAATGVLALLAIRLLRRQTALARLKNDLAATVSHELKTPLSSMRVLVDTLLDSERIEGQKAREYLQLIAQENERLSRLIQNFLTFSRIERKKQTFRFALASVSQITDRAVEAVCKRFEAPGCRFEVQVEDNLPPVMGDPDALATALINLLENAHKYSEEIKHIILCVQAENRNVVFSVKDNGIGISPSDAKQIFRPFYQADRRLSRRGSGCGLGLSIVQSIVTAHNGSVSVKSQPGCGSTFTISLPAAAAVVPVSKEAIA